MIRDQKYPPKRRQNIHLVNGKWVVWDSNRGAPKSNNPFGPPNFGSQDGSHGYVAKKNHDDPSRPLFLRLWDPFQTAQMAYKWGGDPNYLLTGNCQFVETLKGPLLKWFSVHEFDFGGWIWGFFHKEPSQLEGNFEEFPNIHPQGMGRIFKPLVRHGVAHILATKTMTSRCIQFVTFLSPIWRSRFHSVDFGVTFSFTIPQKKVA